MHRQAKVATFGLAASLATFGLADDDSAGWVRSQSGRYKAQQIGTTVVVVAFGSHPTAGFRTKLRRLPIEIFPPQFELLERQPDGLAAQAITSFAEIGHFAAASAVSAVVVHDGHGQHSVKVSLPRGAGPGQASYLGVDGKLTRPLVLSDLQSGVAGRTGYTWTIETDGAWKRQRFVNRSVPAPELAGRLTRAQLADLAEVLQKHDLLTLPDQIGARPAVNPKVFILAFGNREVRLVCRGGTDLSRLASETSASSETDRFVRIGLAFRKLIDAAPPRLDNR